MKISFDFDSTLDKERMQRLAKKFIDDGHEVWITTTRLDQEHAPRPNWNYALIEVANKLGIPEERWTFTNAKDKWTFLDGFDIHFDDDPYEIGFMEENNVDCVGVLIPYKN